MGKDDGIPIGKHLIEINEVIKQAIDDRISEDNKALRSVARTLQRLNENSKPVVIDEEQDESLEKISTYIDLALTTFEKIGAPMLSDTQRAMFHFALSETYAALGNSESALQGYTTALDLCADEDDGALSGQIHFKLGKIYSERGDSVKAETFLQASVPLLQECGKFSELCLAQIELAKLAYRQGEYRKAHDIFISALQNSEFVRDLRSRAVVLNNLGIIMRMESDYERAYGNFQESLLEFQRLQDSFGAAESLNNLGMVHLWRQQVEEAIGYFEKSQKLCQEVGHLTLLAFVYLNKSEYYCAIDDLDMAINTCTCALKHFVYLKNPVGIAKSNLLFGRIFHKLADIKSASAFFEQSITMYEELSIPLGLANGCKEYADVLEENGRHEEAAMFRKKADKIFKDLDINRNLK
jgi:tetratricopeptide (TPR) repeat protein